MPVVIRGALGRTVARVGLAGLVGAVVLTVIAFLIVGDTFDRLEDSLEVTAEAVVTVDASLDVASDSLSALGGALDTIGIATEQASGSSETVAEAVAQTVQIVGMELPSSLDAVRTAMPALIEASTVIDSTLSGLALFGVRYNPDVPLSRAFTDLDRQLAPLPASLRESALVMAGLIPDVQGFQAQTQLLGTQVEEIGETVEEAAAIIGRYQSQTERFDEVIQGTRDDLGRSALLVRILVILAGLLAMIAMGGLYLAGRAIAVLEIRPS